MACSASFVEDVTAAATNGHLSGDIGLLQQAIAVQGVGYLPGGLLIGHRAVPGPRPRPLGSRPRLLAFRKASP